MPLSSGSRLGPYEILGRLGEGGMGEVYRARDTRLARDVAVKVIAASHSASPTAAARFDREWRVVASLSHPNILSVHDVGHQDGVTFAVTELVPGESLRQRLLAGPLPVQKALDFGIQIARGLGAAHQAGIVHRDLKPDNVIVTPDGHVKILDFGLARPQRNGDVDDSTVLDDITEAGVVLGTRGYMAPEQAKGEVADQRADIFAFGSVLYEMLTGDRAFSGASPVEVLHAVIANEPDPAKLSSTHPAIRRVIARCLEKRREERFSSAQDLTYALETAGETLSGSGASAPAATSSVATPGLRWALAAVALLAVGVVVWHFLTASVPTSDEGHASVAMRAQITGPAGAISDLAFSPDGRRLAALAYPTIGQPALWVRDVAGVEWRRVALMNVPGDLNWCEWSPDGESIVYPALVDGQGRLRIVNVASGTARTLEPGPFSGLEAPGRQLLVEIRAGGAWSRSAGLLIGGPRLRFVSPETGVARDAVDADPKVDSQMWPSFLPDGKSFLFTQASADDSKRGVFLGQIGSGRVTRVLNAVANARVTASGRLVFARNGELMTAAFNPHTRAIEGASRPVASGLPQSARDYSWFSVSPAGVLALPQSLGESEATTSRLLMFDRTGTQVREIGEPDSYRDLDLSPDGRRLVIHSARPVLDVLDIDRGLRVPLGSVAPGVTFTSPAWLGEASVAATRYSTEDRSLASIDAATGKVTVLLKTDQARWPNAWSPHTREVVAIRWEPAGTSLWAIPVGSPQDERRLAREGAYVISKASVSSDERLLAYSSNETGDFEVYVQPLAGDGQRQRVSSKGGLQPRWRQNGKELYFLEPDGTLVAVPVGTSMQLGRPAALFKLLEHPSTIAWQYAVLPDGLRVVATIPTQYETAGVISVLTDWTRAIGQ